jgi:hypothetical protein
MARYEVHIEMKQDFHLSIEAEGPEEATALAMGRLPDLTADRQDVTITTERSM